MNRIMQVYKLLGQVLNSPQSFGLSQRPPRPLIEVLSAMRKDLREELVEQKQLLSEDWLSSELSQDADQNPSTGRTSYRGRS
jgi:hypothetical protein